MRISGLFIILVCLYISQAAIPGLSNYYQSTFGGGRRAYSALLTGELTGSGFGGAAVCLINTNVSPYNLNCQVNVDLPSFTSITINFSPAGTTGTPIYAFTTSSSAGTLTTDILSLGTLSAHQIYNLLITGDLSVVVNTPNYPTGEIRGRLGLDFNYFVAMDASQVTDDDSDARGFITSTSNALGTGVVRYDYASRTIELILYHNVQQYFKGSFRLGKVGEIGPIQFTFASTASPVKQRYNLSPEQANSFLSGYFYVNIPTSTYPLGEIRGQVNGAPFPSFTQVGVLTNVNGVTTLSSAIVLASFNCASRLLELFVDHNVLNVKSIGVIVGGSRIVSFPNPMSPAVLSRTLSVEQQNTLFSGSNFQIRIDSNEYPLGELIGSVAAVNYDYAALISPEQLVPAVTSQNIGSAVFKYVGNGELRYALHFTFPQIRDNLLSIQFYNGTVSSLGTPSFELVNPQFKGLITEGLHFLNNNQLNALFNGQLFVVVKTKQYPLGELRGLISRLVGGQCSVPVPPPINCDTIGRQ